MIPATLCCLLLTAAATAGPPALVDSLVVDYPTMALASRLEGIVTLAVDIDSLGHPTAFEVLHGVHPMLDVEAIDAARRAAYSPATDPDGSPRSGRLELEVVFDLAQGMAEACREHPYVEDWPHPRFSDITDEVNFCHPREFLARAFWYRGVQVFGDPSVAVVDDLILQAETLAAAADSIVAVVVHNAIPYDRRRFRPKPSDAEVILEDWSRPSIRPWLTRLEFVLRDGGYQFRSRSGRLTFACPGNDRAAFLDSVPPVAPTGSASGVVSLIVSVDHQGRMLSAHPTSEAPAPLLRAAVTAAMLSTYDIGACDCGPDPLLFTVRYTFP
ncbi:MAG TPA: energy transducer TonB [Candidatus Krumholzibacteria bacterium]|nr:energy transducer TonB [Candidatus Krumholzibacteria bacterium]